MRRALPLVVLLLPFSSRASSASQVEGTPGVERATPAPTPVLPVLPAALSLVPMQLPGESLRVAPLERTSAPTVSAAEAARAYEAASRLGSEAARAASASGVIRDAAHADGTVSNSVLPTSGPSAQAKAPTAKTALTDADPVARELVRPAGERPLETDAQAASSIFGEAKRPEAGGLPVRGFESRSFFRLSSSRANAGSNPELPKPAKPRGTFVKKIVWANIVAFLLTVPAMPVSAALFGVIPQHLRHVLVVGAPIGIAHGAFTMFSYMFVHMNLVHIIGNMFAFWLFGRDLEARLGRRRSAVVYFASGLAAAAAAIVLPASAPIIGASAAVFGVIAAWLVLARSEGAPTPDQRETRLLGLMSVMSLFQSAIAAFTTPTLAGVLLAVLGAGVSLTIVRKTLGRYRDPGQAKALFAVWLVVENVLMFLFGGPFYNGVYVLGHLVGAAVGAALAYRLFLKNSTSRV